KKHQLKKLAEKPQQKTDVELGKTDSNLSKPESHYGSAHDIPVRKSILQTMGHDTYGTPPEFFPGGESYQGNVKAASETIIPSQQSARPTSMVTQPLYGSTSDPHIRASLKATNDSTYGNPPEFLPGGESYPGNVKAASETIIPSQQSARTTSMVTQPMRPQSVVEGNDEYGKIPIVFTEESHFGN
ncbi:MAG: hypothetical protein ACRCYP_07475, partial [Alphaproteobacteria bacterium]